MKKGRVFLSVLLAIATSDQAFACGAAFGQLKPGNKVVGVELKGYMGTPDQVAIDDDGVLILTMAVAHCYKDLPQIKTEISSEQKTCVDEAQRGFPYGQQIYFDMLSYDKSLGERKDINDILKAKCGTDAFAILKAAQDKVYDNPLKCAEEVRGIVKKAVARNAEYTKEQIDPKYLKSLQLSEGKKAEFVATVKAEQDHLQKLVDMLNETPVASGKFRAWTDDFRPILAGHEYQVVKNADEKFNPNNQVGIEKIMQDMGAPFPGFGKSRCGPEFPPDIIKKIGGAIWEPRGSGPGTQGGTGNGGNR